MEPVGDGGRWGWPTAVLADCGYATKADFQRLGRERPGLELYVSVHREEAHAQRRYDYRPLDKIQSPPEAERPGVGGDGRETDAA